MLPLKDRLRIDATHIGKYTQPNDTSGEALALIESLEAENKRLQEIHALWDQWFNREASYIAERDKLRDTLERLIVEARLALDSKLPQPPLEKS